MQDHFLSLKKVSVTFELRAGKLYAVDRVNLTLDKGETLGIVGESGSGKSVMAKTINRLNPSPPAVTTGQVILDDTDVTSMSSPEMRRVRGSQVAMVFQEPMTSLNPVFTIGRQMTAGIRRHLGLSNKDADQWAIDHLKMVGIPSPRERLKQYPHELSGGMRQRVMIAMAICCNPSLLIADEPTTALDVTIQAQILDLLAERIQKSNMALMLISHNLYVVADVCDRICVMYAGRQVEMGPTPEIFKKPVHPYTIGLKESQPQIGKKSDYLTPIPGMVPDMLQVPSGCAFHPRCKLAEKICREAVPVLRAIEDGHSIACHLV
ncbi:MAG: ABC transporter ATP-binding protein [Deltaproteobacteria bacterium]|nr:ABC transporter ATP-binding protein [Deltaproteobacteria bacterium]